MFFFMNRPKNYESKAIIFNELLHRTAVRPWRHLVVRICLARTKRLSAAAGDKPDVGVQNWTHWTSEPLTVWLFTETTPKWDRRTRLSDLVELRTECVVLELALSFERHLRKKKIHRSS